VFAQNKSESSNMTTNAIDTFDATSESDNVQNQLESLLNLITNHQRGNDDEIEEAVSSILQHVPLIHPTQKSIQKDEEDYDNDDNNNDDDHHYKNDTSEWKVLQDSTMVSKPQPVTLESLRKQKAELEAKDNKFDIATAWKDMESIPLGTLGAKLMIIFGDGPRPDPQACALALLSTRECLQNAIKDARALRRKLREEFQKARAAVNYHKIKKKERSVIGPEGLQGIDMSMYFKAIYGHDKLCFDNPCGFDQQQLEMLFPEEMYQYKRFNKMHDAYTKSKNNNGKVADGVEMDSSDVEDEKEDLNHAAHSTSSHVGGYLQERLSQFDLRTERMLDNWYLTFSEVRKGSFLDRGGLSSEDRIWEKHRKKFKGRKKFATWETLPASHVAFLHWIGFDQRSALPPPDAATTEALSFLAYDFFGKIIEKAILMRCLKRRKQGVTNQDDKDLELILELVGDEQLTKEDIEEALNDSTVIPKPLYNASNSVLTSNAMQTYFGPGFEDRIEIEMEQFTSGSVEMLTEEEIDIRKKEDELFNELKKPPVKLDGIIDVLDDAEKTDSVSKLRSNDKKAREKRELQRMNTIESAMSGNYEHPLSKKSRRAGEGEPKRKRGRPRKIQNIQSSDPN
jgi:hypothetical protein